jgi:hypothetical protein
MPGREPGNKIYLRPVALDEYCMRNATGINMACGLQSSTEQYDSSFMNLIKQHMTDSLINVLSTAQCIYLAMAKIAQKL